MIVKGKKENKSQFKWSAIVIGLFATVGLYFGLNHFSSNRINSDILVCDAETIDGNFFINKDQKFNNAVTQSSEESYSGKYSSKIGGEHKYGMSYNIKNPKKGHRYIATVRRKSNNPKSTALVMKGSPNKDVYKQVNESRSKDEDGWELLTCLLYTSDAADE